MPGSEKMELPELDKLREVSDKSQEIGEFVGWLSNKKDLHLCKEHKHDDSCFEPHIHSKNNINCQLHHYDECTITAPDKVCGMQEIEGRYYLKNYNVEKLLAEFYDIDLDKVEQERRALLEEIRQTA